jgi:hypothetical protein
MIGKNPLWVARRHGHSVQMMWRVYAAWMDGAAETDIEDIRRALLSRSDARQSVSMPRAASAAPRAPSPARGRPAAIALADQPAFGTGFGTARQLARRKCPTQLK